MWRKNGKAPKPLRPTRHHRPSSLPLLPLTALFAATAWTWLPVSSPNSSDLRGVSTPSNGTACITGTKGTCLLTQDAGQTWRTATISGAEALDFRDVHAFDANTAVLMSAGEGAASRIVRTSDGGRHWTETLRNPDPKGFFDAIAFQDRHRGLLLGDPVDGTFVLFATEDGGSHWTRVPGASFPPALPSEGAFAASGTCLALGKGGRAWFGTGGGGHARVFRSEDGGATWTTVTAPPAFDRFLSAVTAVPGTVPSIYVAAGTEVSGQGKKGSTR